MVDRSDHRTTHQKVFAAGEVVGDLGNELAALGAIQAAFTMDSVLRGEPLVLFDSRQVQRVGNLARRQRRRPEDRLG